MSTTMMDSTLWEKTRGLRHQPDVTEKPTTTANRLREGMDAIASAVIAVDYEADAHQYPSDCTGDFAYPSVYDFPSGQAVVNDVIGRIGPRDPLDAIKNERRKVYGEPKSNHEGIAMMWAPILQPWWDRIRDMKPVPPHVVALLMATLKIDRARLVYHKDNYDDCKNYLDFAQEWQADPATPLPEQCK